MKQVLKVVGIESWPREKLDRRWTSLMQYCVDHGKDSEADLLVWERRYMNALRDEFRRRGEQLPLF